MVSFILKVPLKKYLQQPYNMNKTKLLFISTLVFLASSILGFAKGLPQEYYKIQNTKKSKAYFFDYIYKLNEQENIRILADREFVKSILSGNILHIDFTAPSFKRLLEIRKKYRVKSLYLLESYLRKIDIVPPAMAIAQAAVESGWGRSRFIKEANNVFGHWTYNPSIGMMPENRDEGATHFIRIFKTVQDSISAYMLNLNRNRAYKEFQNKRYELREKGIKPDGLELSQTMLNYSGIGHDYLGILKNVIEKNKLLEFDKKFYNKLNTK